MPAATPYYQFPYLTSTDRMRATPDVSKAQAERFEKALRDGQIPPGDPSQNAVVSRLNAIESTMPKGIQWKADHTVNSGTITSTTVVRTVPAFTFLAGRDYLIHWDTAFYTSADRGYVAFGINFAAVGDSAGSVSGMTQKKSRVKPGMLAGSGEFAIVEYRFTPPSDLTTQVKFTAAIVANGGNCIMQGDPSNPVHFWIEDKGKQP